MGLFRKKERLSPEPPQPLLSDDCVWSACVDKANELMADREFVKAIECWAQAVDRFDEKQKVFEKLHEEILKTSTDFLISEAVAGRVISAHDLARIDTEAMLKHPEMPVPLLSEEVFYFAKEQLGEIPSAEESAMVYISGSYSLLGHMRFSTDLREVSEKCREVYRFGDYAVEHCKTFNPRGNKGYIKPAVAIGFIEAVRDFFGYIADEVDRRVGTMGEEQLQAVCARRTETREDLVQYLNDALQYCIQAAGSKPIKSEKIRKVLFELIGRYVDAFSKTE